MLVVQLHSDSTLSERISAYTSDDIVLLTMVVSSDTSVAIATEKEYVQPTSCFRSFRRRVFSYDYSVPRVRIHVAITRVFAWQKAKTLILLFTANTTWF